MIVFGDTSGFLAFLDADDPNHNEAVGVWRYLASEAALIVTSNYVVVESVSLLHHRGGIGQVRRFHDDLLGVTAVEWIDSATHAAAFAELLGGSRRGPSLVDLTSFQLMKQRGLRQALAFDRNFAERCYLPPHVT